MFHRKIIDPVLKNLGPSRADYFNRLVDRVDRDPHTETVPNLVYLVLREMIPYLPADLSAAGRTSRPAAGLCHQQSGVAQPGHP